MRFSRSGTCVETVTGSCTSDTKFAAVETGSQHAQEGHGNCLNASSAFDLQFPSTKQTNLLWNSRTSSTAKTGKFAGNKTHRVSATNIWDPSQSACVYAVELPSSNHANVHATKSRPGMYD